MPLQHKFICRLPNGVHARPASLLEEVSRNFDSAVTLVNQRTGREANGKSVLSIIGADIRYEDTCLLTISGSDEKNAMAGMSIFLNDTLPHCDDTLELPKPNHKSRLPINLLDADVKYYDGIPAVAGIGRGRICKVNGFKFPETPAIDGAINPEVEWLKMEEALKKLAAFYDDHLRMARGKVEAEMFKAHRAIARDSEFHRQLHEAIVAQKRTATAAVAAAQLYFSKMLEDSGSDLLRERVLDVQDVCIQLLHQIYGDAAGGREIELTTESIVMAESLTPCRFLALDRKLLKGLVLAHVGVTSHTVILARSFGIPTLVGVQAFVSSNLDGNEAVIDADAGVLVVEVTRRVRRYYDMECRRLAGRLAHIQKFRAQSGATKDGKRLEIAANIASADEAAIVFAAGAESIGLFRTEMLFLDRNSAPDEEEQFQTYSRVLKAAGDKTVIIRTLDIGGDKPLDYLKLPVEENPFLGYRAVRIYPEFESIFRAQIRALIRASAEGQLKILIPLISTVDEMRRVRRLIAEERDKCADEGIKFNPTIPVGAMIEVPSAAFAIEELSREADFFSIGSNDLLQHFMAADRTNDRVAAIYSPLQPTFLRLLKQIVDGVHAQKKWIGLCGEMAGQLRLLPLMIGLGLDEISVAAPAIAGLKAELTEWMSSDCKELLAAALNSSTANEVEILLEHPVIRSDAPLLEPELVLVDQVAATKEEAVKLAVDQLYVLGRTENPRKLEAAIWERERAYSTGFGHGFAIPHCKTDALRFNSLVLLKLKTPVNWNSLDGKLVGIVILLAIRENDGSARHMKVFAALARRVMDEQFRMILESESDPQILYKFLKKYLEAES